MWQNFSPWREANLWALERASTRGVSIKTVQSHFTALHAYANWLEEANVNWWDFPLRKADRCLVRYRGALIEARDRGVIAPSTTSQRMASVVLFYKWLYEKGFLSTESHLWAEKSVVIHFADKVGFERTILVKSTDLAIPNRSAPGERLEDGLLPVAVKDRDVILTFAKKNASEELFLMLSLGFFTGMRIGTLTDLKVQTLERAVPDPATSNLFRLAVGPGADPPVRTKFGVTGQVWITKVQLDELLTYVYSVRRLLREAKSNPENRDLVFLTRFGNPYIKHGLDKSTAINVEMHSLRQSGLKNGVTVLRNFHFHQTRCTFATELARLAIHVGGSINALAIVKEALLHKHEATSLKYIRFVEKTPLKIEMGNAFTREFLGVLRTCRDATDE
ncbi:site-specific integrase [Chromobacterium sp. Beijing]|uniref:site-specific integrase n=1 Tax=Chromobacterium sp. Beijing TaxID=2735795 RepID=UPI001F375651|nr:site-specific integrase [Chromobacterium sp. Beijing]